MATSDIPRLRAQAGLGTTEAILVKAFARLDPVAFGLAVGAVCGLALFIASIALLIRGGDQIGPRLALLGQYFLGYTVTPVGSLIGLVYGFAFGFSLGWMGAALRNVSLAAYLHTIRLRSRLAAVHDVLDPP